MFDSCIGFAYRLRKVNMKISQRCGRDSTHAWALTDLLVAFTIVLLAGLTGFATMSKQSAKARRIQCVANLQKVGLAERVFAADHQDAFPQHFATNFGGTGELTKHSVLAAHFLARSNELSSPIFLQCPTDTRTPARDFASLTSQNISYFLGLDADEIRPQSVLAGDRNLTTNGVAVGPGVFNFTNKVALGYSPTMHNGSGNVVLGDGSVQQMSGERLRTGGLPGRLVIP